MTARLQLCAVCNILLKRTRFSSRNKEKFGTTATYENQYILKHDVVTPLWRKPYKYQLEVKEHYANQAMETCYNKLMHNVLKTRSNDHPFLDRFNRAEGRLCHVQPVRYTGEVYNYRNRNGFYTLRGLDGKPTVGSPLGYGETKFSVKPDLCLGSIRKHLDAVKIYQEFINSHPSLYNMRHNTDWANMQFHSTTTGDTMMIARYKCTWLPKNKIDEVHNDFKEFFINGPGKSLGITSLFVEHYVASHKTRFHHLHGEEFITEQVLHCKFKISPGAFFQTYTKGAELLYSTARDLANLSQDSVLLDVCCGTGTIGILMSDRVKKVIGVEIVSKAVEDAQNNSRLNDVENAEFICNKAHRLVRDFRAYLPDGSEEVVAILNPSRSGANKKVIDALRSNPSIKRVVYLSCKPYGNAADNFVRLVQPETEDVPGDPFRIITAVPVDMFPQTLHYELVLLFER